MADNSDDVYQIFSRVMLIYSIKKLKDMLNIDAGFEIQNVSYLNPKLLEKENYKIIFKNNIIDIKNYHENIRFIIKEKNLLIIKNIFEKKGYNNHIECLIEIIKKSAAGLSVLTGKKVNSIISAVDFDNVYNLGHEEKFLIFDYKISIKSFPPFFISQIVHEVLIEKIKTDFLKEVKIDLPYLNFVKYFCQWFINLSAELFNGNFYFYPVKINLAEKLGSDQFDLNKYLKFLIYNNINEIPFYFFYDEVFKSVINREVIDKKQNDFENYLSLFVEKFFFDEFYVFKKDKYQFSFVNNEISEDKFLTINGIICEFVFGLKDNRDFHIVIIFPSFFIIFFYNFLFNKNTMLNTLTQLKELIQALDKKITDRTKITKDFIYKEKKVIKLDPVIEQEIKPVIKKEKKILKAEDILSVDDKIIQLALVKMKTNEISVILKVYNEKIKNKILKNMSKKTQEFYAEELSMKKEYSKFEAKAFNNKFISILNDLF